MASIKDLNQPRGAVVSEGKDRSLFRGFPGFFSDLFSVIRHISMPLTFLGLGCFAFWSIPQAQDVIRGMNDHSSLKFAFFTFVWGMNTWYGCRVKLMLSETPPGARAIEFKRWIPRLAGLFPFIVAIIGLVLAKPALELWKTICAYLGGISIYFVVLLLRRKFFPQVLPVVPQSYSYRQIPAKYWTYDLLILSGSFALAIVLALFPVQLPTLLGAPSVVALAFSTWTAVIVCVAVWRRMENLPIFTCSLLIVSLCSFTNHHGVRMLKETTLGNTDNLDEHFKQWIQSRAKVEKEKVVPVILVAAEGGGLRAAYWAERILWRLHRDTELNFSDRMFLGTGVSGGSVGLATFVTRLQQDWDGKEESTLNRVLQQDLVSPVTASLVYPEVIQAALPISFEAFDRSRALEMAWENSWPDHLRYTPQGPFTALWNRSNSNQHPLPSLIFNTTRVEDGRRYAISNLQFNDPIVKAVPISNSVRLSTAAFLSARFPYITPVAQLEDDEFGSFHLADGGYFENSGAEMAYRIYQIAKKHSIGRAKFIIIALTNDDPHTLGLPNDQAQTKINVGPLSEITAPVLTLLNARSARTPAVLDQLLCGQEVSTLLINTEVNTQAAPVSWYLSEKAMALLEADADHKAAAAISRLKEIIRSPNKIANVCRL